MSRSPGHTIRLLLAGLAVASGCARSRPPAWDAEELWTPAGASPRPATRPPTAQPPRPTDPRDRAVELAVLRFGPERRTAAERWPPSTRWPIDVQDVWLRHGGALERELAVGNEVGRRALMQARVATEVELDRTTARFGPCPPAVAERLGKVFGLITHHMKTAREIARRPAPGDFGWPTAPIVVTSGFGYRQDPITAEPRFHAGIDLGGQRGDVVSAAGVGRVIHAGWMGGYGRAVIIEHIGGLQTLYGHLGEVLVDLGAEAKAGDAIGLLGSSGRSTAPHLHFEVRRAGEAIDPMDVLGLHGDALGAMVSIEDDGREPHDTPARDDDRGGP